MRILSTSVLLLIALHVCAGPVVLNVKNFGAKGNGITDDTKFIQAAINAASARDSSIIFFPQGTYCLGSYISTSVYFTNYILLLHNNISVKGTGEKTIIRLKNHLFDKNDTSANAHLFYGINVSNINFSDLSIDMNGSNNLVPQHVIKNHAAIFIMGGNNINVQNVSIKNCAGCNMIVIREKGNNARIQNCRFYNGGNYVGVPKPNKNQTDFSFIYCTWDNSRINSNKIIQQQPDIALSNFSGGIELHGSFSTASDNTITGCYPAIYITSDVHPLYNVVVENNVINNCLVGISFWVEYPIDNVLINKNTIGLTYTRLLKTGFVSGIVIPNGNADTYNSKLANAASLNNVTINNNNIYAVLPDETKDKTIGMLLHSLQNSTVKNNTVSGMNYAGIFLMGSKWGMNKLTITNNNFKDFKSNNDSNAVAGYIVATDTYSPPIKNAPGFKNIQVENNRFLRNGHASGVVSKNKKGKFFGAFLALPNATANEVKFNNNTFSEPSEKVISVKTE